MQSESIAPTCRRRLMVQGYLQYSDKELNDYKYGIRFAYYVCVSFVIVGLIMSDLRILGIAMTIAFFGMFPPYHPVDYLYNYALRYLIGKPKLPPRTNQGRFACGMATVWLGGIILLFYNGFNVWAMIAGATLVSIALLVSTTDICIPSMIYNRLFKKEAEKQAAAFRNLKQ